MVKSGLGRGFEALLPGDFDKSMLGSGERIVSLELTELIVNKDQPRKHFDKSLLEELASSIKKHGILQPIVATPKSGKYEIVAGERRYRAATIAGLSKVPVIVRTIKELEKLEIALVENVQRVDLSPIEQAMSIERLHQQFSKTYESIADQLGKNISTVLNIVRLLQLPSDATKALSEGKISEGHARQILALKKWPEKQVELLGLIIKNKWTVRQAEQYVVSIKEGHVESKQTKARMSQETAETKRLTKKIGAPVLLRRMAKGGKLEIRFKSDEQLKDILDSLTK